MTKLALLTAIFLTTLIGGLTQVQAERPARIAFVDTGNTGRSITAEALARALIAKEGLAAQVISRAVTANPYNTKPETNFASLLLLRDIDITHHEAVQFNANDAKFSDVILTMTEAHKAWVIEHFPEVRDHVFTLAEYAGHAHEDVLDAFGKPLDFYQTVLAQLDPLVAEAVRKAAAVKH
jgi:protein-tyrosine phosphatase